MKLVIETDIGRDPDDFFALLYLFSAGIDIKAITISPGDQDQVAVAKFILAELGKSDIPVGVSTMRTGANSSGGMHTKMLQRYKFPLTAVPDGMGGEILESAMHTDPDCELFVCGPLKNVKAAIDRGVKFNRATMQGGFIGYDVHGLPCERLEKFEGLREVATFNLGGDKRGSELYMTDAVAERQWVGKNLCHTIVYDRNVHAQIKSVRPETHEMELFREAMDIYFEAHDAKMFHDPTAAVAHLHPAAVTWVYGSLYRISGKYGAVVNTNRSGDRIAVDIDREKLWNYISEGI